MSRHDTAALATRSDAVVPIVPQEIESDEMRGTGDSNAKEWNKGERERRDRAHSWFATKRRGKARSNGEHEIGEAYGVKSRICRSSTRELNERGRKRAHEDVAPTGPPDKTL